MSSCVDNGFDAHSAMSAPPAFRTRIKFAVSVVTCMHAAILTPANGCDFSNRSRICARTGMFRSAHSIFKRPAAANDASAMSCFGRVAVTGTFI